MKKNITIIHHCGLVGGAGISLLETSEMLSEKYNITIYCPNNPNDMAKLIKKKILKLKNIIF